MKEIVYVCSPLRGDTEKNIKNAKSYCRFTYEKGFIPYAPHLFFTQFMNDDDENERRTHENVFMHGSFVFPDADFNLLKNAEYGFFIWDGASLRTFMNILEMVWYKKPVEVYLRSLQLKAVN